MTNGPRRAGSATLLVVGVLLTAPQLLAQRQRFDLLTASVTKIQSAVAAGARSDERLIASQGSGRSSRLSGRSDRQRPILLPMDLLEHRTPWFARAGIYSASQEHARAARAAIERALTHFQSSLAFTDGPSQADDPLLGSPTDSNVRTAYWRSRRPVPETMDPDRDGCGLLWICPALPFDAQALSELLDITEADTLERGFEPQIGMMCVSCRSIHLFLSIAFDRGVEGEDQRARACHDAILQRLIGRGFYPYRLGVQSMQSIPAEAHGTSSLFRALKCGLDPNNILAPGRYEFNR